MTIVQELPVKIIITAQNNKIKPLIQKANQLKKIETTILKLLPIPLQPHCRIIENKNNCITLGCESAAFAHQIKFLLPELLSTLREKNYGASIASITCRVVPVNKITKQPTTAVTFSRQAPTHNHSSHLIDYQDQLASINISTIDTDLQEALTALHHTLQKN